MKCNEQGCQSSCEKHKKCDTPTGCGSCCGESGGCSASENLINVTSFSMVADCSKPSSKASQLAKKNEDGLNVINDLEIHYLKIYEGQTEFIRLNKLVGITNLQQVELIETNLEDCVYEQMEEMICDVNEFLKAEKSLSARLSTELDVYFVASEK